MRVGYALLVISLAGLCGDAAIPAKQDEPKAVDMFRNITVMKEDKAKDIIPSMQFMCASLKVDCEFCHTGDRSSDEKKAKVTTREMIVMQREINAKNFNGRNQVTCATCHGGRVRPVNLPPVEGVEVRARRSPDVKPDAVLAAYGKAVGADPAHPIVAITYKGTSGAAKTPVETVYSGTKFVVTTKVGTGEMKQGFNGSSAWFTREKGIQHIPMQFAASFINQKQIFLGPDTLPKLTNLGGATAKVNGKDMLVVNGTLADASRASLYFDKETGLLSRVTMSYPTVLGNIAQINDYSDYKKVKGVMLPMTIANHSSEGSDLFHYRSVKIEEKIAPTAFDPPASK